MPESPFSDNSFVKFLEEEKLTGSRCLQCSTIYAPPRDICPNCHVSKMEWVTFSGRGRLAAFTCIAVAPPSMVEKGFGRTNPYCTGVVELDEGARVVARIEGVDAAHPETIRIGIPVRALFPRREQGESQPALAFEPA